MFPSRLRLPLAGQIINFKTNGVKKHSASLTVIFKPNQLSHPRFGIIVSKKVDPKAVNRNLIKRRLSAALESLTSFHLPIDNPNQIPKTFLTAQCSRDKLLPNLYEWLQKCGTVLASS